MRRAGMKLSKRGEYALRALIDLGIATELGRPWVLALLWLGSALAGAALLRAGARIFLGWGDAEDPLLGEAMEEEPLQRDVFRPLLVSVAVGCDSPLSLRCPAGRSWKSPHVPTRPATSSLARICPPCAAASVRAARFTAGPW